MVFITYLARVTFGISVLIALSSFSYGQIGKGDVLIDELHALGNIDLLPAYIKGSEVAMLSSYDRTGGNDDGFSGKYSYIRKEGENRLVMADLKGPGVIERIWTPVPTSDTIEFYFDGEEIPGIKMPFEDLFSSPGKFPFQAPLVGNEVGGFYNYVPIPYKKSCKIVYLGDGLKFHQIQYRTFTDKRKVKTFSFNWDGPENAAWEKATQQWTGYHERDKIQNDDVFTIQKNVDIKPGETLKLAEISEGGRIVGITFDHNTEANTENANLIFRARWDDDPGWAFNLPLSHLFGNAFGGQTMNSIPMGFDGRVGYCHLPMPFDKKAFLEFYYLPGESSEQPLLQLKVTIHYTKQPRDPKNEGRLYTCWRREEPAIGKPYEILNHKGHGHHVGTILYCQSIEKEEKWFTTGFFEGDDVTIIDGQVRMHGTGSEDYFNGGWYGVPDRWDDSFSLPLHGCLDYSVPLGRTAAYRFYMADKVNFDHSYNLTIEHGATNNDWAVDYGSVAFFYADKPTQNGCEPTPERTKKFIPLTELEVPLNFFNLQSLGFPQNPVSVNYRKILKKDAFVFHSDEDWIYVKTSLELPVDDGKYSLFLSYFKSPGSSQLRLYQRQAPVGEWIDISSGEIQFIEKEQMGVIEIKNGRAALTFRAKGQKGKCDFSLHKIYLKKELINKK